MKAIKSKLIKYYLACRQNKSQLGEAGLTLLELLITVAILGILSAIITPNVLDQSAKAKETEAQQNLTGFNRAQNLFFIENGDFSDNFDSLGLGNISDSNSETKFYNYQLEQYTANVRIKLRAIPKDPSIKEYKAGIRREINSLGFPVLITLGCKNDRPGISNLSINIVDGNCTNGEKLYGNGI